MPEAKNDIVPEATNDIVPEATDEALCRVSRIRGDSDAVAPSHPAVALTIALSGLLVLAAYTHRYAVAMVVVVAQLILATAPPPVGTSGKPLRSSRLVPVGLGAVVATILTVFPETLVGAEGTAAGDAGLVDTGTLTGIWIGSAVVVVLGLFVQMVRTDGRTELVASLSDTVSLGVLATFLCGWVATSAAFDGRAVISVSVAAVLLTAGVWSIRGSRWLLGGLAVVLTAGVGAVLSAYVSDAMSFVFGALLGLTAGLFGWLGRAIAHEWRPRVALRWGIEGVLPIALAGPVVFVAGQLYGF